MQPADASPAAQTGPDAVTVPPPRSAPELESAPDEVTPETAPAPAAPPTTADPGAAGSRSGGVEVESGSAGAVGGAGSVVSAAGAAVSGEPAAGGLGEREREILAFERQWWRHAGAKEQAIRDRFGLSATRYYQLLNALLDDPAALAADPVLVGRLIRLRASRARNRRR
ncbi:DUF3263 domain-containing protein [Micromonospora sp. WMMD1082]|uniref:DUF3263 domain-containing protein n=1 Tax=Micromonospora sp. WMMD1082 TaxID=3016104 RepID=UPI00241620EB|nr:DUF3263 domain-containing protein [Micromonospora sp. WMMD1082]MDG4794257.1 DUF3263 domain-containing protein [Micromonospora sp. WMMD1082]